jgi:hypothetical protein
MDREPGSASERERYDGKESLKSCHALKMASSGWRRSHLRRERTGATVFRRADNAAFVRFAAARYGRFPWWWFSLISQGRQARSQLDLKTSPAATVQPSAIHGDTSRQTQ